MMKKAIFFIAGWLFSVGVFGQVTPSATQNYVHKTVYKKAVQESGLGSVPGNDKIETISYFDGLGRPIQSIGVSQGGKDATNTDTDLVSPAFYDAYGRAAKAYLPYASSANNGRYDANALNNVNSYYTTNFGAEVNPTTPNPYSETRFEASPLNRVLKQAAPGEAWKLGSTREIEFDYKTNATSEVRMYTVSLTTGYIPILQNTSSAFYPAEELYKTITRDENHSGTTKNNTTEEFKDKQGRVVLKRTYADITGQLQAPHDTYYVYDDYGNLTYVLPPKSDPTAALPDANKLKELCYQYQYDMRNRLVEKQLPGKDREYIVYNNLDQPILTQDAILKAQNKWLFTKYDAFGRVAYTGISNMNTSRASAQAAADAIATSWVTKTGVTTLGGATVYYSNGGYPSVVSEILTINYYDNYSFDNDGLVIPANTVYAPTIGTVKGLSTGSKVKVLGITNSWITTVTGYDQHRRPIWTGSKNNFLATTDFAETKLDDVIGWVTETKTRHIKAGITITNLDKYTYDHSGKMLTHTNKINTLADQSIAVNKYDPLGQLIQKKVGGTSIKELQVVDYNYNIRGWLKGINDVANLGTVDLFGFKINYNTKELGSSNTPLYNGNISETIWKTANDVSSNKTRGYAYKYDALNRITYADYGIKTTGSYNLGSGYDMQINLYDRNGNIRDLTRYGASGKIDQLIYNYFNNEVSNKLLKVGDAISGTEGFKNGSTGDDYAYDANGNMTSDANKGILAGGIKYNHLNLPTSVTLPGGTILYIYDATGVKQKKIVPGKETQYAGNYIYENNLLIQFSHPEGYVESDGSGGFQYVYSYLDHLGNVRLNYSDRNGNGTIEASSEILDEKNYYPFGGEHAGYNTVINGTYHPYGFGGKEEQDELGLKWMDFGARNYDKWLGRWMTVDPLAEEFSSWSPYNAMKNNPVNFVDPTGMAAEWIPKLNENGSTSYIKEANDSAATLQSQFGLSEKEAGAVYSNLDNGEISGESVKAGTGSEVLKLDVNNANTTDADIVNQTIYSVKREVSKDNIDISNADFNVDANDYFQKIKAEASGSAGGTFYGFSTNARKPVVVDINGVKVNVTVDFSAANDGMFSAYPQPSRYLPNGNATMDFLHPSAFPKDPTKSSGRGIKAIRTPVMSIITNKDNILRKHLNNEN